MAGVTPLPAKAPSLTPAPSAPSPVMQEITEKTQNIATPCMAPPPPSAPSISHKYESIEDEDSEAMRVDGVGEEIFQTSASGYTTSEEYSSTASTSSSGSFESEKQEPVSEEYRLEIESAAQTALVELENMALQTDKLEQVLVHKGEEDYLFFARKGKDGGVRLYFYNEHLGEGVFGDVSAFLHIGQDKESVLKRHFSLEEMRKQHGALPEDELEPYLADCERRIKEAEEEAQAIVDSTGENSIDRAMDAVAAAVQKRDSARHDMGLAKRAEAKAHHYFRLSQRDIVNENRQIRRVHPDKRIPLWGIQSTPSRLMMLSPKGGEGFLNKRYATNFEKAIPEANLGYPQGLRQCLFAFHQLLGGLAYLAEVCNTVHGDTKRNNILVKPIPEHPGFLLCHLADFGKARWGRDITEGQKETFILEQPFKDYATREDYAKAIQLREAGDKKQFLAQEKKRDAFAMGCVLYATLEGSLPYFGVNSSGIRIESQNDGWRFIAPGAKEERFSSLVPPELKQVIQGLLEADSSQRLSALEAFVALDNLIQEQHPELFALIQELGGLSPESIYLKTGE